MKILLMVIIMAFNMNAYLNPNHIDFFKYSGEEILIYGGSGGGKSYSIADKLLLQSVYQKDKKIRALIIRQTFPSLRVTALEILKERANALRLPFSLNKSEWNARCRNVEFLFQSLHDVEDYKKLNSLTNIDFIWLNELLDLREGDYEECLRRLRGGESEYQQVICDFNPIDEYSWVNTRFFQKNIGNVKKIRYNVDKNHPEYLKTEKAKNYIRRLKKTKDYDYNLYKIYFKGEWGQLEGVIYDWDIVPLPNIKFDEVFCGGDFGYSVDPAAIVKIYRKADEYWIQELLYKTEMTNDDIAREFTSNGQDISLPIYWDCAEPKSIEELYRRGVNALPSAKGADSVRAGIDFLKSLKIHIVEDSENIIKERKSYVWQKDKTGTAIKGKPIQFNNHLMDAVRYGIYTHINGNQLGGIEVMRWK